MGDDDWSAQPRTKIVIRRANLVKDAVKEAKKNRFDSSKLICVSIIIVEAFQQTLCVFKPSTRLVS